MNGEVGKKDRVLILGGGLAGIAAACELVDHGYKTMLIERRPYLGGRASSFFHKKIGEEIDIGQHLFMRCCSCYLEFLHKLNTLGEVAIQPKLEVEIRAQDGRVGLIKGSRLPGPLYLLPSFLTFPFLSLKETLRVLFAILVIMRTDRNGEALAEISFYDWLVAHRQSGRAIERFWNFVTLPTLNDYTKNVSAQIGLMVLQEAFLRAHRADLGYARAGLSKLISAAVIDYLVRRDGQVLLGRGAKSLVIENDRLKKAVISNGAILDGEIFIGAMPPNDLWRLLPKEWRAHPFFAQISKIKWNPIVNLHIWYDRPVLDLDFVAFLDSSVQWVFNKSKILGRPGPEQYLCLSLSSAWEYIDMSPGKIFRQLAAELERLFPRAQEAKIEKYLVTKQREATISVAPGMEQHRLPSRTPIKNLYLAGDWTDTEWPSTMEGAVRSGINCADEIMSSCKSSSSAFSSYALD